MFHETPANDDFMRNDLVTGILSKIEQNQHDSILIALVGPRASGKTAIVNHLVETLNRKTSDAEKIEETPIPVVFTARSFGTKMPPVSFFNSNFAAIPNYVAPERETAFGVQKALWECRNKLRRPLLIIIDEAQRLVKNGNRTEFIELEVLRMTQVHYLMILDYSGRNRLEQIATGAHGKVSSMFRTPEFIYVEPLVRDEAKRFIDYLAQREGLGELSDAENTFIHQLGGGYIGLLTALINRLAREKHIQPNTPISRPDFKEAYMSTLFDDPDILAIMTEMRENLLSLPRTVQDLLLRLASVGSDDYDEFSRLTDEIKRYHRIDPAWLGIIEDRDNHRTFRPAGLLSQYAMLSYLAPYLSDAEQVVFNTINTLPPRPVDEQEIIDALDAALPGKFNDSDEDQKRKFVVASVARIRASLTTAPNGNCVKIETAYGSYFAVPQVGLNELDQQKADAFRFRGSKPIGRPPKNVTASSDEPERKQRGRPPKAPKE